MTSQLVGASIWEEVRQRVTEKAKSPAFAYLVEPIADDGEIVEFIRRHPRKGPH